jgi:hypothetical protein
MNPNNDAYWSARSGGGGSNDDDGDDIAHEGAIVNALNALATGDEDEQEEWLQTMLNYNSLNQIKMFIELKEGTLYKSSEKDTIFSVLGEPIRLNVNRLGLIKFGKVMGTIHTPRERYKEPVPMFTFSFQLEGNPSRPGPIGRPANDYFHWFELGYTVEMENEYQRVKRILDDLTLK